MGVSRRLSRTSPRISSIASIRMERAVAIGERNKESDRLRFSGEQVCLWSTRRCERASC